MNPSTVPGLPKALTAPGPWNLLTTNWHVPYLWNLAKLPNVIWWVLSFRRGMAGREWNEAYRHLPANVRHLALDHPEWIRRINFDHIDGIVMHALSDMPMFKDFPQPKIQVFHNAMHTEFRGMPPDQLQGKRAQLLELCQAAGISPVYISDWKAQSYGVPGSVILPGIDTQEFTPSYSGKQPALLRVCSNFAYRDFMNGKTLSDAICHGFPNVLLGESNGEECTSTNLAPDGKTSLTHVGMTKSHEHLLAAYREHRAFVVTNIPAYEDGWNLSVLEAMAVGMPVLSTAHPRTMIRDGVNGFIADDPNTLRGRARELLTDRELAQEMGARARQTVQERFPLSAFLSKWATLIAQRFPLKTSVPA